MQMIGFLDHYKKLRSIRTEACGIEDLVPTESYGASIDQITKHRYRMMNPMKSHLRSKIYEQRNFIALFF